MESGEADPYYHNGLPSYAYNGDQENATLSEFVDAGAESSFESSWPAQSFAGPHQNQSSGFTPDQSWEQQPYQNPQSSYLSMPAYGLNQAFAHSDQHQLAYANYPLENTDHFASQTDSPGTFFSSAATLNQPSYSRADGFQYQDHAASGALGQTVSPAAVEGHEKIQSQAQNVSLANAHAANKQSSRGGGNASQVSPGLKIHDWRQLAERDVKSLDRSEFHEKPFSLFENVTKSARFDGFIFVGSDAVTINTAKANIPRYKKKRSKSEISLLLRQEKGEGPWHPDREAIVKRLKLATKSQTQTASQGIDPSKDTAKAGQSSDSDSDDESEDDTPIEIKKTEVPSPVPAIRPLDPNKAVEYDLLKAIWASPTAVLTEKDIRAALASVWEIFKGIRDRWKQKITSLQHAIEKKDQAAAKAFERRVAEQRRLLESCISLALQHGHSDMVEKLTENPVLLVVFYQFLADRFKESEYAGGLVTSILQLIGRGKNVDSSLLEKTKIDKLLQRIQKRGDEQGKQLSQLVFANAKKADVKPVPTAQTDVSGKTGPVAAKAELITDKKLSSSVIGSKSVEASGKPAKASLGLATTKPTATIPKTAGKVEASDNKDNKGKIGTANAKPSAFFSSLKSASKRASTAVKSDEKPQSVVNVSPEKRPDATSSAAKPAFSFAATMAGLSKQKDEPSSKIEEAAKPESTEEKRKRLRKEQRKRLRVSFKADDELCAIRYFLHDPEEDLGHDGSQVRHVADSRGEGQMLKMHKDLELDDEDDYEPPEDMSADFSAPLPVWTTPKPIDFGVIEDEETARNYFPRGGKLAPVSPESDTQRERENTVLVMTYASSSDIPPTPREPVEHDAPPADSATAFGEPDSLVKDREKDLSANKVAADQGSNAPQTASLSAIFQMINSAQQPLQQQQRPQYLPPHSGAVAQVTGDAIASILATLSNGAQPSNNLAPAIPPIQQQALSQAIPSLVQPSQHTGHNAPAQLPPVPPGNLQAILAQFGGQTVPVSQPAAYNGNPSQSQSMNEDRKRLLQDHDDDSSRKKARNGKAFTPYLPCKYYQEGKCKKGDDCTYIHERS